MLLISPLVPVTELMERGLVLMSMTAGLCSQGILMWVPSPMASGSTPCILSYITALSPPSTAAEGHLLSCDQQVTQRQQQFLIWGPTCVERGLYSTATNTKEHRVPCHSAQQACQPLTLL